MGKGKTGSWKNILGLVAIVGLSLAIFAIPYDELDKLRAFGYPGIFLLSVLSNATIILPTPAFVLVFAMGEHLSPFWLGVAAGTGAALGELTGYAMGYAGQAVMPGQNEIYQRLLKYMEKYGGVTILALAALPNPFFDLGGMAAGALRMPTWKFLMWCWPGKVIRMWAVALAGAGILPLL